MTNKSFLKKIEIIKYKTPYITKKWVNWLNDKEVTKFSDQRFIKHNLSTQSKYIKDLKNKNTVFFKIYFENNEIGNIFLTQIDKNNKNCSIGYLIGIKSLWNKGIATYVIKLTIKYAFNILKIKKIYSWCYSNNIGSKKVLIKNGFKIEGVLKKYYQFSKDKRVDKIFFGLYK